MDKTITYVNMADNEIIQPRRFHLENGDYWCWSSHKEVVMLCRDRTPRIDKRGGNRKIWLPTQDQLQKILTSGGMWSNLTCLHDFSEKILGTKTMRWIPTSMEQLWMAYVMQKEFHQVYDGRAWVAGEV